MTQEVLLSVRDLAVEFATEDGIVRAVNDVSFDVRRGDLLAVVGESGAGKSVMAMSILRLLPAPPAHISGGQILWRGEDLLQVDQKRLREIRGNEIAMIFQDPLTSLNPVLTIGRQISEMVEVHQSMHRRAARQHAIEMLDLVGIPEPHRRVDMYPHEFSGGMSQRAMIAMAIACRPQLLIADEPTTALDVTVQAQVLDVLMTIKRELDSAIVLITHDLAVVAGIATEVLVMYAGRLVETGDVDDLFYRAAHPYTGGLLRSLPRFDGAGRERLEPIAGQPPSMLRLPPGCAFHPRCPKADLGGRCVSEVPELRLVDGSTHRSGCHFAERELSESKAAHQ